MGTESFRNGDEGVEIGIDDNDELDSCTGGDCWVEALGGDGRQAGDGSRGEHRGRELLLHRSQGVRFW